MHIGNFYNTISILRHLAKYSETTHVVHHVVKHLENGRLQVA